MIFPSVSVHLFIRLLSLFLQKDYEDMCFQIWSLIWWAATKSREGKELGYSSDNASSRPRGWRNIRKMLSQNLFPICCQVTTEAPPGLSRLSDESNSSAHCRDVLKASTVFQSGLWASPLLLFSAQQRCDIAAAVSIEVHRTLHLCCKRWLIVASTPVLRQQQTWDGAGHRLINWVPPILIPPF